ncbi:OprD family outer membrane porin [Acinetobacter nosocomialis]|uniref:OprD family outer membrane porin n=1 Tax=Acinetobacter nosocomialis TaxID=106654 RepID=UPI002810380E|nr:OprD family outer membrane porin [Acinetobacter nosocomialis]MDQ9027852.1 OprD family outer membrane porin [Acinetobacter nosocomialis]MDQ9045129.1 OprD family outer membrane porin [Acinetobacter nosocomialis]MDQ9082549.1 OprD family outer membrane porin [Acinetobacter nosocomialis]
MELLHRFKPCNLAIATLLGLLTSSSLWATDTTQQSEDEWKFTLKNAYINRNFDNDTLKDTGSWSQAASLFYKSKMHDTPLVIADKPITIGADASVQYAVRLSSDKHVADTVLPFNKETQSQASDFLKYGATLKLGYDKTLLSVGELWLDLPVTAVDASRQLLASYWGTNLKSQLSDQLYAEIGRVEKVSPRNEEDFKKFSFTANGMTKESDGLNYIDLRYQFTPTLQGEYYFGNLEDLYNKHYVGLEHNWKQPNFALTSKFKYFNAKNDGNAFDIDAQNIGVLETFKVKNHTFGLGYQQIIGESAYPLPDGFLPETYFINWNATGFFKKEEKSYHVMYGYDFKDYVPGLNAMVKYVYGHDFKAANGEKNHETESNVILNYAFQQPFLKGLALQYIRIDYNVKHGNDFGEDRLFVNYTKKF